MADRQPGGRIAEALGLGLIASTILGAAAVVALAYERARPAKVAPPPPVVRAPAPPPKVVAPPPTPAEDPTPAVVAAIDAERVDAERSRAHAEARAGALRDALRSKLADNDATKRRAVLACSQLDALELKAATIEEQADEYARERDVLAAERDANRRELDSAKLTAGAASSFAVSPYKGANGTWRRPIVLDCRDGGATLLPHGPTFGLLELSGDLNPRSNPLIAIVVRAIAGARGEVGPDGAPVVPYVMFLVRPDGIRPYYEARGVLERLGVAFGYELADQDWDVEVLDEPPASIAGGMPPGRSPRRGVILEPPAGEAGPGLGAGVADGIRSLAEHVGSTRPGGHVGSSTAGGSTDVAPLDPSLRAFEGTPEGSDATADGRGRRGGGGAGLLAESGRSGMPEFAPTPPSSALERPTGGAVDQPAGKLKGEGPGGEAVDVIDAAEPGSGGPSTGKAADSAREAAGAARPRSTGRKPGAPSSGSGVETGLPSSNPERGAEPLPLPDGFKPLPEATPTAPPPDGPAGTWDRRSPAVGARGGAPSSTPPRGKPGAGGVGIEAGDASAGTPVAGSYVGKRPDRNLMLTVACGPGGVVVQPGNYKIGKVKLAGPGDPVLRRLRAIADGQQAATPGVTVRPEVRFLVEMGGEDSYMKARRQTILAGLGWPTSLRVADGSPLNVGLGGDRR